MAQASPESAHSPWRFLETQPGLLGSCAVHGKTLRPFRVNGYVAHTVDEYTWMFTCVKLNCCRRISKMFARNFVVLLFQLPVTILIMLLFYFQDHLPSGFLVPFLFFIITFSLYHPSCLALSKISLARRSCFMLITHQEQSFIHQTELTFSLIKYSLI